MSFPCPNRFLPTFSRLLLVTLHSSQPDRGAASMPSLPFGGMENPRLTFATPTILAGDRSLVSLVAHELAHSWSGNLVTNATWNDFWLNEGFTVYFENRIMEKVYGRNYSEMLA